MSRGYDIAEPFYTLALVVTVGLGLVAVLAVGWMIVTAWRDSRQIRGRR